MGPWKVLFFDKDGKYLANSKQFAIQFAARHQLYEEDINLGAKKQVLVRSIAMHWEQIDVVYFI